MALTSEDYYIDKNTGYMIFTESFHQKRGFCCGNGCKHCCYDPKHTKGTRKLNESRRNKIPKAVTRDEKK